MEFNWKSLQNGSDIRGIASDGVPDEPVNLTPERTEKIAAAFVAWLAEKASCNPPDLKISIGCDSRISGPALMKAFITGVLNTGADAIQCGLASTPAMFMSTVFETSGFDGAVMITASHLPFNRNGFKFFTRDGGLDKKDISFILAKADEADFPSGIQPGKESSFGLMSEYAAFLANKIRQGVNHPDHYDAPLAGFHIVVDAGNGSGGFFAGLVLDRLGADTSGSRFLDPDGRFPNHVPNPEDHAAMQSIRTAVVENQADFGIIFDTDVDRAAAVDHNGLIINRNRLIALMAAIVLEEHPGSTIVTDSITSDGLAEFITSDLKGVHHRFKRGYKNVINEAVRLNGEGRECRLAIETSGHAALRENFFLDDGAYLITRILIKLAQLRQEGRSLGDLTRGLEEPVESSEFRIKIIIPDYKDPGMKAISDLRDFAKQVEGWTIVPDNHEGIRVSCNPDSGDGWFLLRLSLHDPVMPLNVESRQPGGVGLIMGRLSGFFMNYRDLAFEFNPS